MQEENHKRYMGIDAIDLNNKRVLLREDFNVPIQKGIVQNAARLQAALPTIQDLIKKNAAVLILSHLGRPIEGQFNSGLSLEPVAKHLSQLLNHPVRFEKNWLDNLKKGIPIQVAPGEVVLCENVRFNVGEKENNEILAKQMASLCDVFVMDAFATAHRAEASTVGVLQYAPIAVAGPLLLKELTALDQVFTHRKPVLAIVGGAKVSSKLAVLESLLEKVDTLIVGGGIANTFIALQHAVGGSLYEANCLNIAKDLLDKAKQLGVNLVIPSDGVVAETISEKSKTRITTFSDISPKEKILDIGPRTEEQYTHLIKNAGTLLWNGPVGVFEYPVFGKGTEAIAKAIAASSAFSVAGGGETLAAIEQYGVGKDISYISTGGGAFLEYIEGKTLPTLAILKERAITAYTESE